MASFIAYSWGMSLEPTHVLVFDDSKVVLDDVEIVLKARGYHVSTALTIGEASVKVRKADIVVIDYHMPEMDGAEALGVLRPIVQRSGRLTLFYLYTADRELALTFKSLGFDGAFTEKGTAETLADQVSAATRMLHLRRFREQRNSG